MPDLWSRIRQARLFQVLAVYLGASWIVLQIADVLTETLSLPPWVQPVALLLLLIGLLVIGTTAWLQAHPPAPPEADGRITPTERVVHRWVLPHFTWRRAILGGVLAFVVLAGVATTWMLVKRPGSLLVDRAAATEAGIGIAVLPFAVTGGEEMKVWREGMLDLLATNLDGVGGLRTIDPRTIVARLRELDAAGSDAELSLMLEAGRRAHARYALHGTVVALGPSVRLTAELHDLEGGSVVARAQQQGPQDSILSLVDRLSLDIVRSLMTSRDAPVIASRGGAEGITTASLEGMKAFLEGESLYRHAQRREAIAAYDRALAADSTFALAWWALSWAWAWETASNGPESMHALERALALEHRLPERIAALAQADNLRRRGRLESIPLLERAVARYPDDAEAHYLLAEAYLHLGDQAVLPIERCKEVFLRAIELDPSVPPFYYHVVPLTLLHGDTALATSLIERYARATDDSVRVNAWRVARRLLDAPDDQRPLIAREVFDAGMEDVVMNTLSANASNSAGTDDRAPATRSWEAILRHGIAEERWPPSVRAGTLFELGRWREAFDALADSDAGTTFPHALALYVAHLHGATPRDDLARLYLTDDFEGPPLDLLSRAAYAASRGDWTQVGRAIERASQRSAAMPAEDSLDARLMAGVRDALIGLRQWKRDDRADQAAETLESVRVHVTSMWEIEHAMLNLLVRWWLADLYAELDRPADAERYIQSIWWPYSHYRLGLLYERLGRAEEARREYAIVLETWRDADPDHAPAVAARRALERLTREGGT